MRSRIHQDVDDADAGFTLVELLVVILIIGILAAIAVPIYLHQRGKAVEASQKSDLRSVAREMETYFVDFSNYPGVSQTAAGAPVTVGTAPNTTSVNVSKGTSISTGTAAAGSFCLVATNTGSTDAWYYDSDAGGLNKSGCA